MSIGYCCINLSINEGRKPKDKITVNRGMILKTFKDKGLNYVSELVIRNIQDLIKILQWNIDNNILVYRMSSDMFPCIGFYNITDLPNFEIISKLLVDAGNLVKSSSMRVGFHPSHFNVLGSQNPSVVEKTIDELNKHSQILDLMELDQNTYYSLNIHVGTTKPTLEDSAKRFCDNFNLLSESCRKRLIVENDDKLSEYAVNQLYDMIYLKIGIPITADSLHWKCHSNGQSWEEAFMMAISTWKTKPLVHHSSSRKLWEDESSKELAHADFIYEKINTFNQDVDVELECKMKDMALLKYNSKLLS